MHLTRLCGVGLLMMSFASTADAQGRLGYRPLLGRPGGLFDTCGTCAPPVVAPPCPTCLTPLQPIVQSVQQPVYQTQLHPVTETTLQPRQVVSYQTVPQVQLQRQTYIETVPQTTYQNVTVDEGSYQMVWVPRPVTRSVAQTVLQPQVKVRDVAVTVPRQVAQVHTEMVPQQVVRYVPETRQIGTQVVGSRIVGWQAAGAPVIASSPFGMGLPIVALPGEPIPEAAGAQRLVPNPDRLSTPAAGTATAPEEWQTVPQRQTNAPGTQSPQAATPPTAVQVQQSQLHTDTVVR